MQARELWTPIRAHAEWIAEFREALYGKSTLTLRSAGDDQHCDVGRWLAHQESVLCQLPEFRTARDIHSRFHRHAAYCLNLANTGRRTEALAQTSDAGELRQLSRHLVSAFQELKRAAGQQQLSVNWHIPSHPRPAR